jgi:hypothetical protein
LIDTLESRQFLSAAFDLIGLTQMRADPLYSGLDGTGVTVAVLDTGLDRTHVRIAPNYVGGRDLVGGGDNPIDRQSHGTHVSGIVAATDPEIGVATDARLVGVKVLNDNGSGAFTTIRDGLRWVYDNRNVFNIRVVNMSLGGGFFTSIGQASGDVIFPEVRRLEAAGITVVSAGGNSYRNNEFQNFAAPGIYSTLVVGATWQDGVNSNVRWGSGAVDFTTGAGRITSFSQRLSAENTIFAPGAFIRSTIPGNRFDLMGGTSQASPIVAGAVAVMQEAAQRFGGRFLSPSEVRQIIVSTATPIFDGDDENDNVVNTQVTYPRLNVYAAVQEVRARMSMNAPPPAGGGMVSDANGTLSGAVLVNPSLDGSETLTVSGRIGTDFGTMQVGAVDVDLFRFSTATPGVVTITASRNLAEPADFDTFLRLFSASGAQVTFDDDSAGNLFSRITVSLTPGEYVVGISSFGNRNYDPAGAGGRVNGATGTYTLSFALTNSDPNGLLAGAVPVNFGSDRAPTTFQGLIGADFGMPVGTSDVDIFKVIAPDDGRLVIDTDTPTANGFVDTFVRVFDANGVQLGQNDDTLAPGETLSGGVVVDGLSGAFAGHATDSFLSLPVVRGRTYFVAISDFDNQAYNPANLDNRPATGPGGTYTLFLLFRSIDVDGSITAVLPTPALAFPFAGLVGTIGRDGVDVVGNKDVDFYRIVVTRAALLEVAVNSVVGGPFGGTPFDSVLSLYDSTGRLLASNDDFIQQDPVLQYVVAPGQTYFLAVTGFGNDSIDPFAPGSGAPGETGDYTLSGRLLSTSSARTISDDAIGFVPVQPLTMGAAVRGRIGTDGAFNAGAADVDLYRFVASDNGVLSADADGFEQFSADPVLRLFDSSGRELAFNDNRSPESRGASISAPLVRGKTYYLGVSGSSDTPRLYNPRRFGTNTPGVSGPYDLFSTFNLRPSLTILAPLATADAAQPFTIPYASLLASGNEADPEGATVSFVVGRVSTGTLTKNGVPVVPGVTSVGPGESLVWTPAANASGLVRAFTLLASDGVQVSARPVQLSVTVNQPPTFTSVRDLSGPAGSAITIPFASLLSAANESDRNRDSLSFRLESLLTGTLLLNGGAVTPGQTLFSAGDVLTFTPSTNTPGRLAAFTLRAFDGRLFSAAPVTLSLRLT